MHVAWVHRYCHNTEGSGGQQDGGLVGTFWSLQRTLNKEAPQAPSPSLHSRPRRMYRSVSRHPAGSKRSVTEQFLCSGGQAAMVKVRVTWCNAGIDVYGWNKRGL